MNLNLKNNKKNTFMSPYLPANNGKGGKPPTPPGVPPADLVVQVAHQVCPNLRVVRLRPSQGHAQRPVAAVPVRNDLQPQPRAAVVPLEPVAHAHAGDVPVLELL